MIVVWFVIGNGKMQRIGLLWCQRCCEVSMEIVGTLCWENGRINNHHRNYWHLFWFKLEYTYYNLRVWTNQVTNMNEYRQVQTDIEVRTRAGRVCCVFGYEPNDALSWLPGERCETRYRSLVRALSSLSKNLICWNTLLYCVLYYL